LSSSICKSSIAAEKLILQSDRLTLRPLTLADCTHTYVSWLNDPIVNQFLETRWHPQSLNAIRDFVEKMLMSENNFIFAIREKTTGMHIGNIKLGPINENHKYADVGYFIGEKIYWGMGYATEAIRLVTQFGFNVLGLYRLQAGAYESNKGSIRALKKVGYQLEGCFRKQLSYAGGREDHLVLGITVDDWKKRG